MARSDYLCRFREKHDYKFVLIEDLNMGRMSVTNDIENVILEVCQSQDIKPEETVFLYQDSEGIWDGFDWKTKSFFYVGATSLEGAIEKFNDLQRKNRV
jgi:hypothetical protein